MKPHRFQNMCLCACTCARMYRHTRAHTCTHAHTHTHARTHTHMAFQGSQKIHMTENLRTDSKASEQNDLILSFCSPPTSLGRLACSSQGFWKVPKQRSLFLLTFSVSPLPLPLNRASQTGNTRSPSMWAEQGPAC